MNDINENNENLRSFEDSESYKNLLRELGINTTQSGGFESVRLHVTRFGNFSILADSLTQIKEVKVKLGFRGFLPMNPGILVAKDLKGNTKYLLTYQICTKFPTICFN